MGSWAMSKPCPSSVDKVLYSCASLLLSRDPVGFDFNRSGGMAVSINGLNRGRQHLCLGLGLNISTLSLGW